MIIFYILLLLVIFLLIKLIFFIIKLIRIKKYFKNIPKYFETENYEKALEYTKKIIKFIPNNSVINYYLGLSYAQLSDPENALKYLNKSIEIDNNISDAHYSIGYVNHYLLGNDKQALKNILKAIEIEPDKEQYYNTLSIIYENNHQTDKSLESINKALKINPEYIQAINNKGVLLMKQGNFFEALKVFKQGLKILPEDFDLLCNAGNAYSLVQEYDDAIKCFENALKINNIPQVHYWLGSANFLNKNYKEAEKHLIKVIENDKENAQAFYLLSVIMQDKNEIEKSSEYWNKAVELNPELKNKMN